VTVLRLDLGLLASPALVRLRDESALPRLGLWDGDRLRDLSGAPDPRLHTLDALLARPLVEIRDLLEGTAVKALPELDPHALEWAAPAESQEVWGAGVTYLRSRDARMEESAEADVYASIYTASRPELFFKCAGWRVVGHGGRVGIRPDSRWNVPEPELAVLSNSSGDVVGYACGNDMSSRSIEGENPLYLPQAKIYRDSAAIGPAVVLAWHVDASRAAIHLLVERGESLVVEERGSVATMVREPASLVGVLHSAYPLPQGAWLLTGTPIVPASDFTVTDGDLVRIAIDGLGELANTVYSVPHTGAAAPPRVVSEPSA
jgi:2-dehydro-3-deoxy-D-arabinonate dehydratase